MLIANLGLVFAASLFGVVSCSSLLFLLSVVCCGLFAILCSSRVAVRCLSYVVVAWSSTTVVCDVLFVVCVC